LLRNPSLTMIFPFSMRILEAVANWPFEAFGAAQARAAAKLELERVGESLVSRALDLVRDVRLALRRVRGGPDRAPPSPKGSSASASEIATIVNAACAQVTSANWRQAPQ
jgi:hypothetical protein